MFKENYEDFVNLRKLRGVKEDNIQLEEGKLNPNTSLGNFFVYLEEAEWQKPIWQSYTHAPSNIRTLLV